MLLFFPIVIEVKSKMKAIIFAFHIFLLFSNCSSLTIESCDSDGEDCVFACSNSFQVEDSCVVGFSKNVRELYLNNNYLTQVNATKLASCFSSVKFIDISSNPLKELICPPKEMKITVIVDCSPALPTVPLCDGMSTLCCCHDIYESVDQCLLSPTETVSSTNSMIITPFTASTVLAPTETVSSTDSTFISSFTPSTVTESSASQISTAAFTKQPIQSSGTPTTTFRPILSSVSGTVEKSTMPTSTKVKIDFFVLFEFYHCEIEFLIHFSVSCSKDFHLRHLFCRLLQKPLLHLCSFLLL